MKIKRGALAAAFVLFVFAGHSLAYILPPGQVLSLMIKRYRGLRSLTGEGLLEVAASGAEDRVSFPMRLYAEGPGKFRLEIQTRSGTRITVINGNSGVTLLDGKLLNEEPQLKTSFLSLFFHKTLSGMMDTLEGQGVDLMSVGFGRFLAAPAFIIGAQSKREPKPTLWLDKGSFRPVKMVFSRTGEELRYLEYLNLKRGVSLPTVVELYRDDRLVKRFIIKRYSLNPPLSSDLFSLKRLKGLGLSGRSG